MSIVYRSNGALHPIEVSLVRRPIGGTSIGPSAGAVVNVEAPVSVCWARKLREIEGGHEVVTAGLAHCEDYKALIDVCISMSPHGLHKVFVL